MKRNDGELTRYFTPTAFRRKRKLTESVNKENGKNSVFIATQDSTGDGTAASPLSIDAQENKEGLEIVIALTRIDNARSSPRKQTARAGDAGTYILRQGAILGRSLTSGGNKSLAPKRFRNQKIDLGIHGADSGVSRKQLTVEKLNPLTFKQLKTVTNQVLVHRYDSSRREMEHKTKLIEPDEVFVLRYGDVITMDGFRGTSYKHCFRIVKCLTPTLRVRKDNSNGTNEKILRSKSKVVDLICNDSTASLEKPVKIDDKNSSNGIKLANGGKVTTLMQNKTSGIKSILQQNSKPVMTENSILNSLDNKKSGCEDKMEDVESTSSTTDIALSNNLKPDISATVSFTPTRKVESGTEKRNTRKTKMQVSLRDMKDLNIVPIGRECLIETTNSSKLPLLKNTKKIVQGSTSSCFSSNMEKERNNNIDTISKTELSKSLKPDLSATLAISPTNNDKGKNRKLPATNGELQEVESGKPSNAAEREALSSNVVKVSWSVNNVVTESYSSIDSDASASAEKKCKSFIKNSSTLSTNKSSGSKNSQKQESITGSNTPTTKQPSYESTPSLLPEPEVDKISSGKIVKEVSVPDIGDYLRVKYKASDAFHFSEKKRSYESWWLGKVERVTKLRGNSESSHKIKLKFMDKTRLDFPFPDKDIQKVEKKDGSGLFHALVPSEVDLCREKAFDFDPKELTIGDLVDVNYQNGEDCWARGRVASVDTMTKTCTIAYDDGEVECYVPMNENQIILVERGCSNLEWLSYLGIYDDYDRRKKVRKRKTPNKQIGHVTGVDQDKGKIKVSILFYTGSKVGWTFYEDFVVYIFNSLLSRVSDRKLWPKSIEEKKDEKPAGEKIVQRETKPESESRKRKGKFLKQPEKKSKVTVQIQNLNKNQEIESFEEAVGKAKRNHSKHSTSDKKQKLTSGDDEENIIPKIKEQKHLQDEKTALQRKKRPAKITKKCLKFSEEEWIATNSSANISNVTDVSLMKEIHPTLSNSFFRALNTSEPLLGTDLMTHATFFHCRGMNIGLGRNVRELLVDGPMSEGVNFPDAHRLESMMLYIEKLSSTMDGEKNIGKSCSPDGWLSLKEMIEAIVEPCYAYGRDEGDNDVTALERVTDSLHLSAMGARLLAKLFKAEFGELANQKYVEKRLCREGPIARAIWNNENGSRRSIQTISKAFVDAWVRYGHYSFCNPYTSKLGSEKLELLRNCQDNSKALLKELGIVLSYALWLYGVVEGISLESKDLAYMIKDAYDRESIKSIHDQFSYLLKKEKFSFFEKKIKIRIALCLDSALVSSVQINLADEFGIRDKFESLFL